MASASNHQREIDTDLVRKTVDAIQASQRPPSGEHQAPPCKDHESRIMKLEFGHTDLDKRAIATDKVVSEHTKNLADGTINFVQIRADIHALTRAVESAVKQMEKIGNNGVNWWHEVLRAVISWGVPAAVVAIVWLAAHSGAVPIKGAP